MTLIKKSYDKDLKLYLEIVQELTFCYKNNKKLFFEYSFVKQNYKNYYTFKKAKKRQINLLLARLRIALNIIDITKFVDLNDN